MRSGLSKNHASRRVVVFIMLGISMWIGAGAGTTRATPADAGVVLLSGKWAFRLNPDRAGIKQRWYSQLQPGKITLPGTTDENGYGQKNAGPATDSIDAHPPLLRLRLVPTELDLRLVLEP